MISELDPVELERLSKAATRGLDHAAIYKEARARTLRDMTGQDFDFHHIQVIAEHVMRSALRTGQLVPAQPSGDEVEAVARKFSLGDRVTKTKGSSWTGLVVGFYSTSLTPIGYAVESENEPGSVQIYPESALQACLKARENSDG